MKILFIITKSEIGGVQVFVLNLARSLKERGYDVEVAAGDGDYLSEALSKEKIPFYFLNSLQRNTSIFKSLYYIYDLYHFLKMHKYDLIHLNSSNALLGGISTFFLGRKPKTVFTFHGLSVIDKNFKAKFFIKYVAKLYFKIFLKSVDKTVFVSKSNYDEVREAKIIREAEVIINGLDEKNMNFLPRNESRTYFSKKCNTDLSENFIIGSVGRLTYQKNYDFLLENFDRIKQEIPEIRVVIIGNGPYYERFQDVLIKRGIQKDFFFVGEIKDTYQYLKAFDLFTLPSHHEGFPISMIEAIIAEIPILASAVGGNGEILANSPEQLFKLNDIDDFIFKIKEIRKNNLRLINYNAGLKKNFTLTKMVNEYIKIYTSLTSGESTAPD